MRDEEFKPINEKFDRSDEERQRSVDLLRSVGSLRYGPNWHTPMAHDLGVNRSTLRKWLRLQWQITPEVMARLREEAYRILYESEQVEDALNKLE